MVLRGITNEHDFFSEHYLATRFEVNLKAWEKQEIRAEKSGPNRTEVERLYHRSRQDYTQPIWKGIFPKACGDFQVGLLAALGYDRVPVAESIQLGSVQVYLPLLAKVGGSTSSAALWILDVREPRDAGSWGRDPLALTYREELFPSSEISLPAPDSTVERVIDGGVFGQSKPPQWIFVFSLAQAVLLDRAKWAEGRLLRFELEEVLADQESWRALRGLLHRNSLLGVRAEQGMCQYDAESLRHAKGVTADLKYAMQYGVEKLGQEVFVQLKGITQKELETAAQQGTVTLSQPEIKHDCLQYLYRLLFLFFVEAQPETAPPGMRDLVYRAGYGLESLRAYEMQVLAPDAQDSYFLHESLQTLFALLREGTPLSELRNRFRDAGGTVHLDFGLEPLGATLFERATCLDEIQIPDRVLLPVLKSLSLTQAGARGKGRISYAQLGAYELGAVYESLLSFTGFVAATDLIEVKKARAGIPDPLERTWFVPRSCHRKYESDEVVYDELEPRVYPQGQFLFRQTGFAREDSATFYTPQSLTTATVKLALRELQVDGPLAAADVLEVRICEPAMGSAAFLLEAVNQLADLYLQRCLEEQGKRLSTEERLALRQRTRAYITARNAFGVDLNPEARHMGELSLWLNCLNREGFRPSFQHTLYVGNSLIGCRREVRKLVKRGASKKTEFRVSEGPSRSFGWDEDWTELEFFHFLLPVSEMISFPRNEKKELSKPLDAENEIGRWIDEAKKPVSYTESLQLQFLSSLVDEMWRKVANEVNQWRAKVEEILPDSPVHSYGPRISEEEEFKSPLASRLCLAMDYWCSLWFWPLDRINLLPSRSTFLSDLHLILTGQVIGGHWVLAQELEDSAGPTSLSEFELNYRPISEIAAVMGPRYRTIKMIKDQRKFFHWELFFADFFRKRGGFDLVIGNPPWVRLQLKDSEILAAHDPTIEIRGLRADQVNKRKPSILSNRVVLSEWRLQSRNLAGQIAFFGDSSFWPHQHGQPQTASIFLTRAFGLVHRGGLIAFLHPSEFLQAANESKIRRAAYSRLRWLIQFSNDAKLFGDIDSRVKFALGVYRGQINASVSFKLVAGLVSPHTLIDSLDHDGSGPLPRLKDSSHKWDTRGHQSRILQMEEDSLRALGLVLDPAVPPIEARLPLLHLCELTEILKLMARVPQRLEVLGNSYLQSRMWHETDDRVGSTPLIRRETGFRETARGMVLSGPIVGLSNPLAKSPKPNCLKNTDYEEIDLVEVKDDYLPRSNYLPAQSYDVYRNRTRIVPWNKTVRHIDCPRLFVRGFFGSANVRSLQGGIWGEGFAHVHVCESFSFQDPFDLVQFCALWNSLPLDFLARAFQVTSAFPAFTSRLPYVALDHTALYRTLQLNCLTTHHATLWAEMHDRLDSPKDWSSMEHPSLLVEGPQHSTELWTRSCSLRCSYSRRQALLEVDVLVAKSLGLSLEQLLSIYEFTFPILKRYEGETWFDQKGRIVWSCQSGVGMKMSRKKWENYRLMKSGELTEEVTDHILSDDAQTRTITYEAPFTRPKREEDYRIAWEHFENAADGK